MFDKTDIEKYQNIKAPASLKTRIENAVFEENLKATSAKKSFFGQRMRALSAIAACFVLMTMVATVLLADRNNVSLYFEGEEITQTRSTADSAAPVAHIGDDARAMSTAVFPLEIKTRGDVEITVSGGELFCHTEGDPVSCGDVYRCKGNVSFCWVVEKSEGRYTMTVQAGSDTLIYVLEIGEDAPNGVIYQSVTQ